ncbi:MAG: rhodanese-like domain-containing protein [Acidobacteriota bacterium]
MKRSAWLRFGGPLLVLALLISGCRSAALREGDLLEVLPGVAFEMLRDTPTLKILDVRPSAVFHGPKGHLVGAVSVPLARFEERREDLLRLRGETFLVYGGEGIDRALLEERLLALELERAVIIDGGIEAWIKDGFGTIDRDADDDGSRCARAASAIR